MTPAARELALCGHAKRHSIVLNKAQDIRISLGLKPSPYLVPVLVLTLSDRVAA